MIRRPIFPIKSQHCALSISKHIRNKNCFYSFDMLQKTTHCLMTVLISTPHFIVSFKFILISIVFITVDKATGIRIFEYQHMRMQNLDINS